MHWNPSLSIGDGFLHYQLMGEKKGQAQSLLLTSLVMNQIDMWKIWKLYISLTQWSTNYGS